MVLQVGDSLVGAGQFVVQLVIFHLGIRIHSYKAQYNGAGKWESK